MNIKLWDNKYIIKTDQYQYILALNDKYQTPVGYFGSITNAIWKIVDTEKRANDAETLAEYIEHIKGIEAKLDKTLIKIKELVEDDKSFLIEKEEDTTKATTKTTRKRGKKIP